MIRLLVEAGANPLGHKGAAIRAAADIGSAPAIEALVAAIGRGRDETGRVAGAAKAALEGGLLSAAVAGHADICRLLLESGADVDARDGGPQGCTSLMYAATTGDHDVVRLIISFGADVNCTAMSGWSALMMAAAKCHTEVLHTLLAAGADPSLRSRHGVTALHLAKSAGCDAASQLLTSWPTRPV